MSIPRGKAIFGHDRKTRMKFVMPQTSMEKRLKNLISRGLLCAGLGMVAPVHAQSWSVGIDAGAARLQPKSDTATTFDGILAIRADYWFSPNYAIEVSAARANGSVHPSSQSRVDRNFGALAIGARAQWSITDRAFVVARLGIDHTDIRRETPVTISSVVDPVTGTGSGTVGFRGNNSDNGPYIGIGVGWRWNPRWSSTIEITRLFDHAAFGQSPAGTRFDRASHFDTATLGLEYRFE